jgi:hypothetical protein
MDDQPFGRRFDRIVHIHDVRRGAEQRAAPRWATANLTGIIQAVDFRHQRRHHRRAGRHFDHLDVGVVALADLLQGPAHGQRDVVALAVTVLLVDQVDLDIADVGPGAQVVLPDQAVEIDRRGGAGVDLIVGHFLDRAEIAAQLAQHPGGLFQRGAFRHIHNDLKFRLVVERQHFQHDQLEIRQS